MNHPLREGLEVTLVEGAEWVRCSRCQHRYCRSEQNWRDFCEIRLLPPTKAGGLMSVLEGQYLLRQFYCPSCAILLDTDFVEEQPNDAGRT